MKSEERKRINAAIEIHKNLEAAALDKSEPDIKRGFSAQWTDGKAKQIDFIPDKDNRGMSVYFSVEGKRTAQIGLSTKAAILLADGIGRMLKDNPELLEAIKAPAHA